MAKAEGYQTVTKYIKVGQENATIEVVMEKETEASVSSNEAANSVSDNDVASTSGGKLTIDAPVNAEVYLDGSYIGIAPVSFNKTAGIHVITLRANGYVTKSYTINIEDVKTSESMSFSELVKETEEEKKEDDNKKDSSEETSKDEADENKDVSGNAINTADTTSESVSENSVGQ